MIASFPTMLRGGDGNALDAPVAALAGLSVAFLAFAAPADIIADLVAGTGLASVIPAAEPPLGMKARFLLGASGALATFGLVFLLLRWLDRVGSSEERTRSPGEEREAPRLRRRDIHPDAPPRPPLYAGADLGEPIGEEVEPVFLREEPEEGPAPILLPEGNEAAEAPEAIPDLMKRLEQGLARRRTAAEPTQITDPPALETNPPEDRLQSAIESLQRLASRQS